MKTETPLPGLENHSRHLPYETLEKGIQPLNAPKNGGQLELIVVRNADGQRQTPQRIRLEAEAGVPGDKWSRKPDRKMDAQISVMRADVARLFANGQELSVFGDNLLVHLDLSTANLPTGTRLRLGAALLEVTPLPHTGCAKFRQRVGDGALQVTAAPHLKAQRLRGLFLRVIEEGEVTVGDRIQILTRPA